MAGKKNDFKQPNNPIRTARERERKSKAIDFMANCYIYKQKVFKVLENNYTLTQSQNWNVAVYRAAKNA